MEDIIYRTAHEEKLPGQRKDYSKLGIYVKRIEKNALSVNRTAVLRISTYAILLVTAGTMRIRTGEEFLSALKGQGILLYPGEYGLVSTETGEDCQWTEVCFAGKSAPDTLSYLHLESGRTFFFHAKSICSVFDNIMACQKEGEHIRAAIHLQTLLISVMEASNQRTRDLEIQRIHEYMTEHFHEAIDLTMLAAMFGTSISYFSKEFRQKYGRTPIHFLNQVRIANAKRLLETTDLKIHEIAGACGFEKPEYFYYVFRKQEGCTPTQFRIRHKQI